jgi:hypothetical protein
MCKKQSWTVEPNDIWISIILFGSLKRLIHERDCGFPGTKKGRGGFLHFSNDLPNFKRIFI